MGKGIEVTNIRKQKKKRSALVTVLIVLLVLVVLAAAAAALFTLGTLNKLGRVDQNSVDQLSSKDEYFDPDAAGQNDTLSPQQVAWALPSAKPAPANVKNILLIGQDRRPGELRARSDTMIICSINEDTKEITLTSLMRDMYVPFPGDFSDNRINAAYAFGGMPLLDTLIKEDFGVTIDGNVEVDFDSFIEVMDLIAPLEIELKDYEAGYMNSDTNWNLSVGYNQLSGEQLLRYVRIRHVGHADWERTERQRRVLRAAFDKVRNMSLAEINELANAALPCFSTDLTNKEILAYIYTVISNKMTIGETYRLPVEGTYTQEQIRGMAVLLPDLKVNAEYLKEYIYGSSD